MGRILTLEIIGQDKDLNYDVQICAMRSGVNLNNWDYRNIQEHAHTFAGVPILCAYPKGQIGDGHNMEETTLPTGEIIYDFTGPNAERIVGAISDDPNDISIDEVDGEEWVHVKGKLWRFYNRQLVDFLAKQGSLEVSSETEVYEFERAADGVEIFYNWRALGITILNPKVAPAIPGANIKALKELNEHFNEIKLAAASYHPNEQELPINEEQAEPEEEQTEEEPTVPVFEENNHKPQNKSQKGDSTTLKSLSKKQVAELAPKFEGYTALGAGKDDNGIHVALMSADGATYSYTMGDKDETIAPEKIVRVDSLVSFDFGEDAKLDVYAYELTDTLSASLVAANNKISGLESELEDAKATINTMTENERNRRVQAAKKTAKNTLDDFNANRKEKIENDILTAINAAIDNGDYTDCVTAAGEWTGEAKVEDAVYAACARRVKELDKAEAEKAEAKVYAWAKTGNDDASADGIAALLKKAQIKQ